MGSAATWGGNSYAAAKDFPWLCEEIVCHNALQTKTEIPQCNPANATLEMDASCICWHLPLSAPTWVNPFNPARSSSSGNTARRLRSTGIIFSRSPWKSRLFLCRRLISLAVLFLILLLILIWISLSLVKHWGCNRCGMPRISHKCILSSILVSPP